MPADMAACLVACLLAGWFACVLGRSGNLFFGNVNKCVGRFSLLCCIALLVLQVAHILCQQCVGQHWTTNSYQFASTMSAYLRGDLQSFSMIFQLGDVCDFLCLFVRLQGGLACDLLPFVVFIREVDGEQVEEKLEDRLQRLTSQNSPPKPPSLMHYTHHCINRCIILRCNVFERTRGIQRSMLQELGQRPKKVLHWTLPSACYEPSSNQFYDSQFDISNIQQYIQ